MSEVENNNGSVRHRIALLLRSKIAGLHSLSRKSKLRLGIVGAAMLAAFPVAALALQGFSGTSDTGANLSSQPANEASPVQVEANLNEDVPPTASSTTGEDAQNHSSTNTQVTVNGESIQVPENGSVHKTINTNDGEVTVNIDNNTSTDNSGSSYTSVQSFSSSTSSNVNVNQSTNIGGTSQ